MFTLPQLPYEYNALEPYIDAKTMEIHHSKHHQAYVNNLNTALEKAPDFLDKPIEEIITQLDKLPAEIKTAVQNNGGGHYNHSFFWQIMTPGGSELPEGELKSKLIAKFTSIEKFKEEFSAKAMSVFGSGWMWLVEKNAELVLIGTPLQNSPMMDDPTYKHILGLDVWEHAYYLKHQNLRADYIKDWWNVVNWQEVANRYQ